MLKAECAILLKSGGIVVGPGVDDRQIYFAVLTPRLEVYLDRMQP
jgi:hypothetical protein